jgi:hypothetical protein
MQRVFIILYEGSPMYSLILPYNNISPYEILDKYARKYEFDRRNLSFSVVYVLEDKELLEV